MNKIPLHQYHRFPAADALLRSNLLTLQEDNMAPEERVNLSVRTLCSMTLV